MRHTANLKNKVELSLDSRQVFFLLFGGAAVACLVFVLGIMVGKRLESKNAPRSARCGAELESLDRLALDKKDLTFHKVLVKKGKNPNLPPEVHETAHIGEPGWNPSKAVANKQGADKAKDKRELAARRKEKRQKALSAAKARKKMQARKKAAALAKARKKFTLQVSSFKERNQAEAMVKRLESKGLKPYLISSHIPRRGMWYRVRIGAFSSWKDAIGAKKDFEKNWRMTAYVMRRK